MESAATLAISSLVLGAILLLGILVVIVWLQRQTSQTSREQQQFLSTLLSQSLNSLSESQSVQLTAIRESAERTQERLSSQLSSAQTQFLQHQQVQTQEVMVALSSSVNQATSSVSSTATQLAELVASSQAMIASKDPIAYQQVRAAAFPFAADNGTEPYTSTEDLARADAERTENLRIAEQSLATIMNLSGVQDDNPYPAAGALFGPASAAP